MPDWRLSESHAEKMRLIRQRYGREVPSSLWFAVWDIDQMNPRIHANIKDALFARDESLRWNDVELRKVRLESLRGETTHMLVIFFPTRLQTTLTLDGVSCPLVQVGHYAPMVHEDHSHIINFHLLWG